MTWKPLNKLPPEIRSSLPSPSASAMLRVKFAVCVDVGQLGLSGESRQLEVGPQPAGAVTQQDGEILARHEIDVAVPVEVAGPELAGAVSRPRLDRVGEAHGQGLLSGVHQDLTAKVDTDQIHVAVGIDIAGREGGPRLGPLAHRHRDGEPTPSGSVEEHHRVCRAEQGQRHVRPAVGIGVGDLDTRDVAEAEVDAHRGEAAGAVPEGRCHAP